MSHQSQPAPLDVRAARKRFADVQALDGVSLEAEQGELVGLLGPNGAGKTTLIRAIAGRLRLDDGEVRLFGQRVRPTDPRPALGVVPQEIAIYPLLTARENLQVFGRLAGVAAAALGERVAWALDWADLGGRADEPTSRFSGGMKRRLNIACSLVHRPRLVLLDEPTVGVDPQSRERIYEMLAALQRDGVSMILTTHHLEEAERRCERIVIIDRGRIVAGGTLSELVAETLGRARRLRVRLATPLAGTPALPASFAVDEPRLVVTAPVEDAGRDVAAALGAIVEAGGRVREIDVTGASLQDVFITLTGRELRE